MKVPNQFSENKPATLRKKRLRRIERRAHLSPSFAIQRSYSAVFRRIRRIGNSGMNYQASCLSSLGCIGLGCSSVCFEMGR